MACSFNEKELSEFIPFLRDEAPQPLPQLKAARIIGHQDNDVWVMNNHLQIDCDGFSISPEQSGYVWLNEIHMSDAKLLSTLPLSSTPLDKVVRLLQCCISIML